MLSLLFIVWLFFQTTISDNIPNSWMERQNSSSEYLFVNMTLTCDRAQAYCEDRLANLVTVQSGADTVYLQQESQKMLGGKRRIWIGLRKPSGDQDFSWSSGRELNYTYWTEDTNPENAFTSGCYCSFSDFETVGADGQWRFVHCGDKGGVLPFVCQRPKDLCSSRYTQDNCIGHGGNCTEVDNVASCWCPEIWTGRYCETEIITSSCDSNPCVQAVDCVNVRSGFICFCLAGFTGSTCQDEILNASSTSTASTTSTFTINSTPIATTSDPEATEEDITAGVGQVGEEATTSASGTDGSFRPGQTATQSRSPVVLALISVALVLTFLAFLLICYNFKSILPDVQYRDREQHEMQNTIEEQGGRNLVKPPESTRDQTVSHI